MLILVAVTVNTAVNSGLFGHAKNATTGWAQKEREESSIGNDGYVEDTVNKHLTTGITLNTDKETIKVGNTKTLKATVNTLNGANQNVLWSSSNPGVATVNENEEVTAIASGTTTITATIEGNTEKSATCLVAVPQTIGWSYSMKSGEQTATRMEDEVGKLTLKLKLTDSDTLSSITVGKRADTLQGKVSFNYKYYCADCRRIIRRCLLYGCI